MLKLWNPRKSNESGFTLIELMIVVVIIGILAAIAIPIFANQQAEAMKSTIKTDLRNAATVMQTEAARNKGKFTPWVPSYDSQSPNNQVTLDASKSNHEVYCLQGTNTKLSGVTFYYSSIEGKVSDSSTGCPEVSSVSTAGSFAQTRGTNLASEKALVVVVDYNYVFFDDILSAYGYTTVDVRSGGQFMAMSDAQVQEYEIVALQYFAWGTPADVRSKAEAFYNQGGKVIQDGNDVTTDSSPWVNSVVFKSNSGASYDPTYLQGLSPSFPYTFPDTAFEGDSGWNCITGLRAGAVSVATSVASNGDICHTMFAANNSSSGRWVYLAWVMGSSGPVTASLDWLHS